MYLDYIRKIVERVTQFSFIAAGLFGIIIVFFLYAAVPLNNQTLWRMDKALAVMDHPADSNMIERYSFFGTRYTNTSECTYAVGHLSSTSLTKTELIEKYKNSSVNILGFGRNIPVRVVIADGGVSFPPLPLDNPADGWIYEFMDRVDTSSTSTVYYLAYLYVEGRSPLGDYRCYE